MKLILPEKGGGDLNRIIEIVGPKALTNYIPAFYSYGYSYCVKILIGPSVSRQSSAAQKSET